MTNEQEIRAVAIQAAATCAVTVGMPEPGSLLKVAEMMEVYIASGAADAQKVIDSWSDPQSEQAPQAAPVRGISRAQELANQVQVAATREEVLGIKAVITGERQEDGIVNIDGVGGTLEGYVKHRLKNLPDQGNDSLKRELGL